MAWTSLQALKRSAESLRSHLRNSPEYRQVPIERAFISWYIRARFGNTSNPRITDGPGDGGIDAVVLHGDKEYVLQSKYESVIRAGRITRSEAAGLERVATLLSATDNNDRFNDWLETVRPEHRNLYQQLRRHARQRPGSVRFLLLTTKRYDLDPHELVQAEDLSKIAPLWRLFEEGYTPPAESIDLTLDSAWHIQSEDGDFTTYVGLADVLDFVKLMEDDRMERLFAQNVRTDLKSRINKGIKLTYEKEPDRFWLGNNGIYIVCRKVRAEGKKYTLLYPSIINGSQTLHSIAHSRKRHSCKILVRILEMNVQTKRDLLSEVIRRTNAQNPMKLVNLCAHDPYQLSIARFLDRYRVFYERREKEWVNEKKAILAGYVPVQVKDVAQWLSVRDASIGLGLARARVAELFQPTLYEKIFDEFHDDFHATCYHDLTTIVWAGLVVGCLPYYLKKTRRHQARIAQLLLVRLLHRAVSRTPKLTEQIADLLREHRFGNERLPIPVIRTLRTVVERCVGRQKRAQRRDENVDFSNFFKSNEHTRKAFAVCCSDAVIAALGRQLQKGLERIN